MAAMRDRLDAPVLVGVGAAFDFHAGLVPQAPELDAVARPGVGLPPLPRAAPPLEALPALQPALRDAASCASTAPSPASDAFAIAARRWSTTSPSSAAAASACRSRSSFADAGLTRARRRQRRRAPRRRRASGACRSRSPAPQEVLERVGVAWSERPCGDAAARAHIVITLGTPSFSHIEIDLRDIRSVLDDLLPHLSDGHALDAALDDRAAHDRVRRRLPRQAPRLRRSASDVFVAHVPERIAAGRFFEEIVDAAVHRRRRRRALRRGRRASCSSCSARRSCRRRRSRPSSRRSGRTSCATRRSRCPTC